MSSGRPASASTASGARSAARWALGLALAVGTVVGAVHLGRAPLSGPQPGTPLPAGAARHVDAQMAALGTPTFVDGMAGLLLLHAGHDAQVAAAMTRRSLARAPGATGDLAAALRQAGFDPAVAGLAPRPGARPAARRAPQTPAPQTSASQTSASQTPASQPAQQTAAIGIGLDPTDGPARQMIAPAGISPTGTLRPAVGDLATPQLR